MRCENIGEFHPRNKAKPIKTKKTKQTNKHVIRVVFQDKTV